MTKTTPRITVKATVTAFVAILIAASSFQAHAFIFLVAIAATSDDEDPMKEADIMNSIVENTVVAELPEGTAYAFLQADGGSVGIHPKHGKLEGNWKVESGGKTCVTWNHPSGSITNCANISDHGDGKYQWGDREFLVKQGDVKNLNNK